jgi:hypothetical protein
MMLMCIYIENGLKLACFFPGNSGRDCVEEAVAVYGTRANIKAACGQGRGEKRKEPY